MKPHHRTTILGTMAVALFSLLAAGCATTTGLGVVPTRPGTQSRVAMVATVATGAAKATAATTAVSKVQRAVVEGALSLLGKQKIVVRGRQFNVDCSGVVCAAYYYAGIDLTAEFNRYTGGGVARIYKTLESHNLLYNTKIPAPGDLIFWDNTYDANGDGKWNDPLTHIAVVVKVSDDGLIQYVHDNYRRGIVIEYMDLEDPNAHTKIIGGKDIVINSAMRMKGEVTGPLWMSSQLYRVFGKGYELTVSR